SIRFLRRALSRRPRAGVERIGDLKSLPGIRARKHRHVYQWTVADRRVHQSVAENDAGQVDDRIVAGHERTWCVCRRRGESFIVSEIHSQARSMAVDGISLAT